MLAMGRLCFKGIDMLGLRHGCAAQAIKLFERSCGLGSYIGCMELAGSYEEGETGLAKDLERAHHFYAAACQRGYPDACTAAQRLDSE
jgi:TPR repeat protein